MIDPKYSGMFSGIGLTYELGFRTYQGTDCGWPSCSRDSTHHHCRICGYGTSQAGNIINHRRICTSFTDFQQKEIQSLTPLSDPGVLQHDMIYQSAQPFSYYHVNGSGLAIPTQSTNSGNSNAKLLPSQQGAMFNFVIPSQNSQYSGLYSTQTVFPNNNLFSPSSFNGYGQLESPWLPQPRIIPPGVHSSNSTTTDILASQKSPYEKLDPSSSPSCCSRISTLETASIGMCSPLTSEAYKAVSKDFHTKLDPPNWYSSPSNFLSYSSQPTSCKFSESASSCSISLLLLEQNDLKQGQDCLTPEETCFEAPKNEEKLEPEVNSVENLVTNGDVPGKNVEYFIDKCSAGLDSVKSRKQCKMVNHSTKKENNDHETLSASGESDIIVEESESEVDSVQVIKRTKYHILIACLVCNKQPPKNSENDFIRITRETPVKTNATHISILTKLAQVIDNDKFDKLKDCLICPRCLNLINVVDQLEMKLATVKKELVHIYKSKGCEIEEDSDVQSSEIDVKNSLVDKLVCEVCGKQFSSTNYLEKHKQCHTKSFSYYCEYCGKGFAVLQTLQNHILLHSNSSRFQCDLCGKKFLQKNNLNEHIKKHRGEYRYKCGICQKGFIRRSVFKTHTLAHNSEAFICQHCGKQFKNSANLSVHIKICSGDLRFSCDKCDKKFPIRSLLKRHISVRHNSEFHFICGVCRKGFGKKSDLKTHMRSHSDNKPFQCAKCDNRYKSLSNLNQHSKVHSVDGVLECNICQKKFTRQDSLNDHMNQHTGNKPYKCTTCWKTFANRINFNIHIKRHNGTLKKTPCPVCGKLFSKGLKDHLTSHSGQKPYSCKQCMAVFTVKSSLNKHLKLKHNTA